MEFYSVRMRAAEGGAHERGGIHVSGGERLVPLEQVETTVRALVQRSLTHEKGRADFVNVTVERVAQEQVRGMCALPVSRRPASSVDEGRKVAVEVLVQAGVRPDAALRAVQLLAEGPAPGGGVMRGAIVMDADSGIRLEEDQARGVRVAMIDWHPEALVRWREQAQAHGIATERIQEALALATKVAGTKGTVAELCWSDDPSYVNGNVASPELGFVRIPHLKEPGSPLGGRVFFVRDVGRAVRYCEALQEPVLIAEVPEVAVAAEDQLTKDKERV